MLCLVKIVDPLFQLRFVDRGALIKTRVLNGGGGRDGQELCTPQVFSRETVRLGVADRQKNQGALRGHQRNAEPGAEMGMALECLPVCFVFSVGEEDTLLASQDSLQKGDAGGVEREGI